MKEFGWHCCGLRCFIFPSFFIKKHQLFAGLPLTLSSTECKTDLLSCRPPMLPGPINRPQNTIISSFSAEVSESKHWALPSLIQLAGYIHLFSVTVNPLPSLALKSSLPAIEFACCVPYLHLPTLVRPPGRSRHLFPLLKVPIHLSLPWSPLWRKRHNEISASLIVLIKTVRRELRVEKYGWQLGKTRVQLCSTSARFFSHYLDYFAASLHFTHTH